MAPAPSKFYRVEDDDSQARTIYGKGVLARNTDTYIDFSAKDDGPLEELIWTLEQHLCWSSGYPSPLISVYGEKITAIKEAERRKREGKQNVTITKINVRKLRGKAQYRNARKLADRVRCWIPKRAWHNSKHEWLFLHCIPQCAVVSCVRI